MDKPCRYYGFIYITTNMVNVKRYIGKRVYDKRGEWKSYLGSGILLRKAVDKYGKQYFQREIIDFAISPEELNEKEMYWIKHYNAISDDNFYNIASGGDGGNVRVGYSEEQYLHSEEKRIFAVKKGHICGEHVKTARLTEIDVKKIIKRIKANESLADIGRDYDVSEMTISDIKNKRTWKHLTEHEDFSDYRIIHSKSNQKPVNQYDMNMNYIATYKSAIEAERKTGISRKLISRVCRGTRSSTCGFIFKFV